MALWLLIALALDRVQLKLGQPSYGSAYCGIGAVDAVNARAAQAPMAYRVLVPWLIGLAEWLIPALKPHRLTLLYEPLKIGLLAFALAAAAAALGMKGALLVAALLPATFYFDYWDGAVELGALALALTGDVRWALIGGLLLALSRETAPLAAVTYMLVTHDVGCGLQVLSATLAVLLIVRLWAGRKPLYCDRWMVRINAQDVRRIAANRPVYTSEIAMSLGLTALTLGAVVSGRAGPAWPVPLAVLAAGWTMARAAEPRVFAPCLLWIVGALIG